MKTAMEFMLHGKAYLQSDQHQRIGRLLSTYGSEFPEAINPEKYLEIAHQYHREHFGPRQLPSLLLKGNDHAGQRIWIRTCSIRTRHCYRNCVLGIHADRVNRVRA